MAGVGFTAMRSAFALVAVGLLAAFAAPGAVGGYKEGPVVARGESPAGVPWRINVDRYRHQAIFQFSLDPPGYEDAGYFTGFRLPIHRRFLLTGVTGSSISPFPENDVSGIADGTARKLVIKMSSGEPVAVKPERAPKRLHGRFGFLRGLRFFDVFYEEGRRPRVIRAFDSAGELLGSRRSHGGSF